MSMFSSALKSIGSTNITSNYTISPSPTSHAGPWRIHDAKHKSTGKPYSVFVFDRKSLDRHGSSLGRSGAAAFKRVAEEVTERLKKEALALARLRHPSVLELVEPVEDARGGGLQFVTEPVTASLAGLLAEKDEQERAGGVGGRSSRYVTEDADGVRKRRDLELDELEIQKGLLQVAKALAFLHDNELVHGNLTPEAILVNAKGDWKISGLSFCSPAEGSTKASSFQAVSLYEILNPDARLPRSVQLDLDYTSPDLVLDSNLNVSADMFSLGLLAIALYSSPHRSPLECNGSLSSYKRLFQSSSSIPNGSNNFKSSRPLPKDLTAHVLPRLITRRPAQRLTAKEFQESELFDNILVSTIRFIDNFPAKTPNEKVQFLRGLIKVLPSFPKSVMDKKLLPALLEETKDKDLLALILGNVFKIISLLPSAKRAFGDKVRPVLKELFVTNAKQSEEKDPARDAGLMVFLENIGLVADNSAGKDFTDDILPVLLAAILSPTHPVVDVALRSLPVVLPVLDFGTIKNVLFPVVAAQFSKTNSLAIKVRGLQAFVVLCGGSAEGQVNDDGLDGFGAQAKKSSSSSALDKYTMQEKIVPLIKGIKTKEPAVMIAALKVLKIVGDHADADFIAMDILPLLWQMSLGPLLDLKQFQTFMELIRTLSKRVEEEQTKKLQETASSSNGNAAPPADDFMSFGGLDGTAFDAGGSAGTGDDFVRLVKGKASSSGGDMMDGGWDTVSSATTSTMTSPGIKPSTVSTTPSVTPSFSWSTPSPTTHAAPSQGVGGAMRSMAGQQTSFRTVTPDLGGFAAMTPSSTQFSQPLQPQQSSSLLNASTPTMQPMSSGTGVNWSTAAAGTSNPWASSNSTMGSMGASQPRPGLGQGNRTASGFSLPPPPVGTSGSTGNFSLQPPAAQSSSMGMMQTRSLSASNTGMSGNGMMSMMGTMNLGTMSNGQKPAVQSSQQEQQQQPASKSGLDRYQSLL